MSFDTFPFFISQKVIPISTQYTEALELTCVAKLTVIQANFLHQKHERGFWWVFVCWERIRIAEGVSWKKNKVFHARENNSIKIPIFHQIALVHIRNLAHRKIPLWPQFVKNNKSVGKFLSERNPNNFSMAKESSKKNLFI